MLVSQINPQEAFFLLKENETSFLFDVRTQEEQIFTGFVDPSAINDRLGLLPLKFFPNMEDNPDFAQLLSQIIENKFGPDNREIKLLFICRSGARSQKAAEIALSLGFKNCYNVISGFEGDLDENQHRNKLNGWKATNLPWKQS